MHDDPCSLDPRTVRLLSNITLSKHLFEGLLRESPSTQDVELALANSYSISADNTQYTFQLKPTTWSNGDPLTAEDFKESWEQVILGTIPSVFHYAFMDIKNAKEAFSGTVPQKDIAIYCPDPQTLIVQLDKPVPYFPKLLCLPAFAPVHKLWRNKATALSSKTPFIGNGPFILKKRRAKQHLHLAKNPLYHEASKIKLSGIHIQIIPDIHTASLLFESGKIDWQGPPWSDSLPLETSRRLEKQGKLQKFDIAGTSWLIFNTKRHPFCNKKLRKALSLAIDRHLLINTVLHGRGSTTLEILPPCLLAKQKSISNQPNAQTPAQGETNEIQGFQQQLAKKLFLEALEELHLSPEDFKKIPLLFPATSPVTSLVVQAINQQWKETLGIHMPLQGLEFSVLQERKHSGFFSLTIGDWLADFHDPMAFLSIFSSPFGIQPYILDDPAFSSLVAEIQGEEDSSKRFQLIQKASDFLEKESCVVPLYHHSFEFSLNKRLTNLKLSDLGTVDFKYSELKQNKECSQQ
ncbi:peptide ABC transporter substrate-binding protein [Chlamydiifrater phoenicopteri]|uniref:peptide ABC transporter substrate-binding protein n=1 Tax=Chlamydiifrater phoenicopteri TaxID=2681469 RepID=UPI001BCFC063|nr:peptide ABC transporter substrate-binding protein [Chlamydiifrater phoenicopteri]